MRRSQEWLPTFGGNVGPTKYDFSMQSALVLGSFAARYEKIKWPLLCALTALAYLQYSYADVLLQVLSLPLVIVFVLVNGQLPPV
jgi:hypothetical protein